MAEVKRTSDAEWEVAFELCDYRCATIQEAKARASYILTAPSIMQFTANDFFDALLESMA